MSAVVYWLLDAQDNVLYVGSTNHIGTRIKSHAKTKPWWSSVDSVAYSTYMLESEALRVEREDITTLHPVHNIVRYLPKRVHVPRPARVSKKSLCDNIRAEMARIGVRQAHLAAVLGLSQAAVSRRVRGDTPWRVSELQAVATHLKVPLSALLPSEIRDDVPA